MREASNKFYQRNLIGEEGLVYDFNLTTGDTVLINNPMGFVPIEMLVSSIDSVFVEPENKFRKRYSLLENNFYFTEEYWIEGIGSMAGITHSSWDITLLTGGDDFTLLCYFEEDTLKYKDFNYTSCFYGIVNIKDSEFSNKVKLYPNPIRKNSILHIDFPIYNDLIIRIYNSSGLLIEEQNIKPKAEFQINSDKYRKGMYYYQVINDNKTVFTEKFIVL
jgi:hypothetical protein